MGCLSHAFTQGRKRGGAIDRPGSQSTLSALHARVNVAHKITHVPVRPYASPARASYGGLNREGLKAEICCDRQTYLETLI